LPLHRRASHNMQRERGASLGTAQACILQDAWGKECASLGTAGIPGMGSPANVNNVSASAQLASKEAPLKNPNSPTNWHSCSSVPAALVKE